MPITLAYHESMHRTFGVHVYVRDPLCIRAGAGDLFFVANFFFLNSPIGLFYRQFHIFIAKTLLN